MGDDVGVEEGGVVGGRWLVFGGGTFRGLGAVRSAADAVGEIPA